MSTNLMSERISIHIIVPNLPWRSKTKNFLSIFCRPPPPPPREEKKKGKENFLVFPPGPEGGGRGAPIRFTTQSERTIQIQATTRAERATSFVLEIGSNLVQ